MYYFILQVMKNRFCISLYSNILSFIVVPETSIFCNGKIPERDKTQSKRTCFLSPFDISSWTPTRNCDIPKSWVWLPPIRSKILYWESLRWETNLSTILVVDVDVTFYKSSKLQDIREKCHEKVILYTNKLLRNRLYSFSTYANVNTFANELM